MRQQSILEITIVYALLEAALWTPGHVQVFWMAMAATCIIVMTVRGERSPQELGLRRPSGQGTRQILAVAFPVTILILLAARIAGTLHVPHGRHSPILGFFLYAVFALVQEFILQSFFFVRAESILRDPRHAVWATAALFALAHLPNPILVVATFLGSLFFCEAFRRYRNIYPVAAAHLMLGLAVAAAVPDVFTHQMKVGLAYLTYR